jgi:hypothetical protein
MELNDALKFLAEELVNNPSYRNVVKEHITTNFINSYANICINLPSSDFLFCPTSDQVQDIADDAGDHILDTLINYILKP